MGEIKNHAQGCQGLLREFIFEDPTQVILLAGEPSCHTVSLARFHLILMVSLCNDMQEVPGFNMAQVWGIKIIPRCFCLLCCLCFAVPNENVVGFF